MVILNEFVDVIKVIDCKIIDVSYDLNAQRIMVKYVKE